MTDRQKAIEALLLRLQTSDFVTSEGFVNGYRISSLVTQLRKLGHQIKRTRVMPKRTAPGASRFYVANGYVKYSYINQED